MSSESSNTLASLVVQVLRTIEIWEFVFLFLDFFFFQPFSSSIPFSVHVTFSVEERASSQDCHPGHFPAVKGSLPWDLDSVSAPVLSYSFVSVTLSHTSYITLWRSLLTDKLWKGMASLMWSERRDRGQSLPHPVSVGNNWPFLELELGRDGRELRG